MNIIKEMLNLPDTPSGKKKLNKLITKLGLGKKQKGDILKNVVNGNISNGGGGVDIKEWYYSIDVEKMIQDLSIDSDEMKLAVLNMINVYGPTAYLIAGGYDDNHRIGERTYIDLNNVFFFNRLKAIKLSNISCIEITSGTSSTFSIFRCYGNLEERGKMLEDLVAENMLECIKSGITEISKEQYYDLIQIPIIEINKE